MTAVAIQPQVDTDTIVKQHKFSTYFHLFSTPMLTSVFAYIYHTCMSTYLFLELGGIYNYCSVLVEVTKLSFTYIKESNDNHMACHPEY